MKNYTRKDIIKCYNCGIELYEYDPWCEYNSEEWKKKESYKNEYGKYECSACKQRRHKSYDDYVDPLGFYH